MEPSSWPLGAGILLQGCSTSLFIGWALHPFFVLSWSLLHWKKSSAGPIHLRPEEDILETKCNLYCLHWTQNTQIRPLRFFSNKSCRNFATPTFDANWVHFKSVCSSVHHSIRLSICPSVCLPFVRPSIHTSICLSVCLSVLLFVHLYVVCPSTCPTKKAAINCDYHQTAIYHLLHLPPPLFRSPIPNY